MINLTNIRFDYPKKRLFNSLSLEIPQGSVCGLLGENGTGKSTLLNLIVGTLLPKNGSLTINGMNTKDRLVDMYKLLYYIQEEFALPAITLTQFIKAYAPFYQDFSHERMLDYAQRFHIEFNDRLDRLSMGQRKKVLITFAFATSCPILILDEPTNGLDIPSKSTFRAMIAEMANEDRTIIISSHQIRDLDMLLDRVIILDKHNVILNSSIKEIEEKLYFGNSLEMSDPIYSSGPFAIKGNQNSDESTVNIELLFNATLEHKDEIKQIFNKSQL